MNPKISPPKSIEALVQRAKRIAGKTLGELALELNIQVPKDLTTKKGWQGQFIETCLGADSGNLSQPDFYHLGIELKTLPIDFSGKVKESTYVCVVNLINHQLQTWQQSVVYKKLSHVLWVPIAQNADKKLINSRIATPFLWQPNKQEFTTIQKDWEHTMNLVSLGKVDQLNAKNGEILQVRPKAAHSRITTKAIGKDGESIDTLPRGFYLRTRFTQKLLNQYLKSN